MLNCLFKAKPRKDGSKNVVNETGFRRNTRIKMRSFCRFCRFAFANHSDVCFFHYFGTSRFTTRTEDHWRSRFLQSRCRRILTHLQIIQSPSSQCSSSSQELQRESPPRPVGTEQAQRICQQVKSASFKDFGRPGLPIFLRSPFAFHFLCQFSSLLLPFVFDLIQEFPFCSERLGLLASNPSRQHEETDPASKFEVDEVCEKVLGWFQLQGFFFESFLPTGASQANDATTQSSYNFSWRNKALPHDKSLASHIILHWCVLVTRSSPCFRQPTVWVGWCRLSLQSFQSLTHPTRLY